MLRYLPLVIACAAAFVLTAAWHLGTPGAVALGVVCGLAASASIYKRGSRS